MKKLIRLISMGAVITLAAAQQAQAILITVVEDNGNNVGDFSNVPNELDFDVTWANFKPVIVDVSLEQDDDATNSIAFSGFHLNATDSDWTDFHISLTGATWQAINSINPSPTSITGGAGSSSIDMFFSPFSGTLRLGNPNTTINPGEDWEIAALGSSTTTFTMALNPTRDGVVPLPGTAWILGLGLAALGAIRSSQKNA